jgi:acyl carrier protein
MNRQLTAEEKKKVYDHIREFLSEELGVPIDQIKPDTRIIDDLGGDSIIYLELIEEFKKKYRVTIEVRVIGKYFQKHPIYTVGQTAQAVYDIVERGESLLESEE